MSKFRWVILAAILLAAVGLIAISVALDNDNPAATDRDTIHASMTADYIQAGTTVSGTLTAVAP